MGDPNAETATVLTVDDSPTLRSFLRDVLQRGGYQVVPASSGEEALQVLDHTTVDVVLADLVMPKMDGYELCRHIKDLDPRSPLPVILLTSKGDLTAKVAGFDAGADDYILKPFKPEELLVRVRAQLRLRNLQEQLREKNRRLQATREQLESRVSEVERAYKEISVYRDRTKRALDLASRVQRTILPSGSPEVDGFSLSYMYEPADSVAGDFFDFVELEGGRLGFAVGDVAGKGAAASLLMVLAMSAVRQAASECEGPGETLERVNEIIRQQYDAGEMITLFYAILDPEAGTLEYASAGHEPGFLLHAEGTGRRLGAGGPFLGIFPTLNVNEERLSLREGDRLLVVTDGVLDRFSNHSGEEAGRAISQRLADTQRTGAAWLNDLPDTFAEGSEADDTTALLLEVKRGALDDELVRLRVTGVPQSLRELRAASEGVADRVGLDAERRFALVYATDEAVGQMITRAEAAGAPPPRVTVRYLREDSSSLTVEVTGKGVELSSEVLQGVDVAEANDLQRPTDLGLFLIRRMTEDLVLERAGPDSARVRFSVPL